MKITLKWDGESGDGKRAFVVAEENDGWNDLRLEVDTDDCNGDHAKAAMQEVINRCNSFNKLDSGRQRIAELEQSVRIFHSALRFVRGVIDPKQEDACAEADMALAHIEGDEAMKWKEEDPRMLREQIRVADMAFNILQERFNQMEKERDKALARLHWLHDCSTGQTDPEGYEWGIYRVKWKDGNPVSVLATFSDFSDLDAEMARELAAFDQLKQKDTP